MKHLKKFNENIERKDLQETIDEILDRLSKKGKLSKSERDFMDEASNGTIKDITKPNPSGKFWSDMANPHNLGIMWMGKNGVFNLLKSVEDEDEDNEWNKYVKDREESEFKRQSKVENEKKKFFDDNPELQEDLNKLLDIYNEFEKYQEVIDKKYRSYSKSNYKFRTSLDYAFKSKESLVNCFGYYEFDKDGESIEAIGYDKKFDRK